MGHGPPNRKKMKIGMMASHIIITYKIECSPDTTKVEEIKVPEQKYDGGSELLFIKATIHGKVPRENVSPLITYPAAYFGAPHILELILEVRTKFQNKTVNLKILNYFFFKLS